MIYVIPEIDILAPPDVLREAPLVIRPLASGGAPLGPLAAPRALPAGEALTAHEASLPLRPPRPPVLAGRGIRRAIAGVGAVAVIAVEVPPVGLVPLRLLILLIRRRAEVVAEAMPQLIIPPVLAVEVGLAVPRGALLRPPVDALTPGPPARVEGVATLVIDSDGMRYW